MIFLWESDKYVPLLSILPLYLSIMSLQPGANDPSESLLLQKSLNILTVAVKLQAYIFCVISSSHNILLLSACIFPALSLTVVSVERAQRSL